MANVDFSHLLKKPAGEAKKPEAIGIGNYLGMLRSFEFGETQNEARNPFVRFQTGLVSWPEDFTEEDKLQNGKPVDLSKRALRKDFYLTEDALYRLDLFLRSMGISLAGRSYEECIAEAVGKMVTVEVQHYTNRKTGEIGNQLGDMKGEYPTD